MMTPQQKARQGHARTRLRRLVRLRAVGASDWVIKDEQVRLICNRRGLRGQDNRLAEQLRERHVLPKMEDID